jgi:GH3 auxin-responsive promoter
MTTKEMDALDRRLGQVNDIYALFRSNRRLERPEVLPVRSGTFEKIRKNMMDMGVSPSQLKVPRVMRDEGLIQILERNAFER